MIFCKYFSSNFNTIEVYFMLQADNDSKNTRISRVYNTMKIS